MEDDDRFRIGYSRMPLEANKYFSGIPVNTNMSVVHVPTNVFDGGKIEGKILIFGMAAMPFPCNGILPI